MVLSEAGQRQSINYWRHLSMPVSNSLKKMAAVQACDSETAGLKTSSSSCRVAVIPLQLFLLWFLYILAINGPVASPKYRLPIEPVLMVLTGAGLSFARRRSA